jgi:hypothetical protein
VCSDVFMGDTKHISIRIPEEILLRVDEQSKRMRWSRNATLNICVEYGLPDLELNRGVGIKESVVGGCGSEVSGEEKSARKQKGVSESKKEEVVSRFGEKCPHGYMNWMVCPKCNPKEK